MDIKDILAAMTPEVVAHLKRAIETGRWDNGTPLTPEQKEQSLQSLIAYEHHHQLPESQRIGYIDKSNLKKNS